MDKSLKPTEFKHQDIRADGYIFDSYYWKNGRWGEHWLSPKAWERKMKNFTQYDANRYGTPEYKKQKQQYSKNRRLEDENFRIASNLRSQLRQAIKNGQKSGVAIENLGCSIDELKLCFEKQFKNNMSWSNWGQVWQIDHIKTLSTFDLSNSEQVKEATHYSNLQPLTCEENRRKRNNEIWHSRRSTHR